MEKRMKRWRSWLTAWLTAVIVALALLVPTAPTPAPAAAAATGTVQTGPDGSILITGLDLHDGMVAKFDGTYYLYGTMYACGFQWGIVPTTFCGMGVSTAPSLTGPWSAPTLLFSLSGIDPYTGWSWANLCKGGGAGCFNPRMIRRPSDGVYILWFNSPYTYSNWGGANAYNAMGCNGPAGPCGVEAGGPNGSSHKPALGAYCGANGDFSIHTSGNEAWLICTKSNVVHLDIVHLDTWWTNGNGIGAHNVAGLTKIEGPGVYYDTTSARWVLTYGIPNCGYCTSTGAGYATASSPGGPYTPPVDIAAGGVPGNGRRMISADSCGGQPRTVSVVDGVAYEGIDLWMGTRNETAAGLYLAPLVSRSVYGVAGDGGLFRGGLAPWACEVG
jgi:hypothetical protein